MCNLYLLLFQNTCKLLKLIRNPIFRIQLPLFHPLNSSLFPASNIVSAQIRSGQHLVCEIHVYQIWADTYVAGWVCKACDRFSKQSMLKCVTQTAKVLLVNKNAINIKPPISKVEIFRKPTMTYSQDQHKFWWACC